MSGNFVQSRHLRSMALKSLQFVASAQVWRKGARLFVNSIPKAGTHLLAADLTKFSNMQNSRYHIHFRQDPSQIAADGTPLARASDVEAIEAMVGKVRGGQFCTAHVYWSEALSRMLCEQGLRMIFVTRDPRDVIVSRFHYVMGLRRHPLHEIFMGLPDDDARWAFLIHGDEGHRVQSFDTMLRGYAMWAKDPEVLSLSFEDLVGERGGGSLEAKQQALLKLCQFTGMPDAEVESVSTAALQASATLRKGQANAWGGAMPEWAIDEIHATCADSIRSLGYRVEVPELLDS